MLINQFLIQKIYIIDIFFDEKKSESKISNYKRDRIR